MVADVDGDGDVDIVHSFTKGFAYAEQRNGSFVILKSYDNPFYQGFWVVLLFLLETYETFTQANPSPPCFLMFPPCEPRFGFPRWRGGLLDPG